MTRPAEATRWPLAYVAGQFPLPSETFVYREVRGLRQRGWTVVAVSLRPPPPAPRELADLEQNRIVVYRGLRMVMDMVAERLQHPLRSSRTLLVAMKDALMPGERTAIATRLKILFQSAAALSLAHRLRPLGVRHIHCHFSHAPTTVGMYAAMQLKIPFSFTGHANDIFQRRSILKIKLRRAAFVACISQWHRGWYASRQPDRNGKYEVIRCGVEIGAGSEKRTPGKELQVLTVCRLVEKKGTDTLIGAIAELNRRNIAARLTIAGDGPDRPRLGKMAEELNCRERIHWLGEVSNDQVFSLLADVDVFALPCREDSKGDRDGIPVVLMEAMASGTPVVAGELPAIGELIEDEISGLLVKGNNPTALADKLAMLWRDAALRRRLADSGRKKVESEFSLALNLDRLERRLIAAQKRLS